MEKEKLEDKHKELKKEHIHDKEKINILRSEVKSIRKEAQGKTLDYITAGFGIVAGLAWNEAIKSLINYAYPGSGGGIFAMFLYAIVITLVVVVLMMYLRRIFDKEAKSNGNDKTKK